MVGGRKNCFVVGVVVVVGGGVVVVVGGAVVRERSHMVWMDMEMGRCKRWGEWMDGKVG